MPKMIGISWSMSLHYESNIMQPGSASQIQTTNTNVKNKAAHIKIFIVVFAMVQGHTAVLFTIKEHLNIHY